MRMEVLKNLETDKKSSIRVLSIERRKAISYEDRIGLSDRITNQVIALNEWKTADIILAYADYNHEVATDKLVLNAMLSGKKVYMPITKGSDMEFFQIHTLDEMRPGNYGIREPIGLESEQYHFKQSDQILMLVPGTAFDKEKNRMGYGKGYYDRYLERYPIQERIGLAFACQIFDTIPHEKTDIKMKKVVSESAIYE